MRQEDRMLHFRLPARAGGLQGKAVGGPGKCPAVVTGTGATWNGGACAPEPSMRGCARAHSRQREESSGSRRSIVMAALFAQERLTVFCIYLLTFLLFFKKECSRGYLESLSRMCVQWALSLRPVTPDGQL